MFKRYSLLAAIIVCASTFTLNTANAKDMVTAWRYANETTKYYAIINRSFDGKSGRFQDSCRCAKMIL